MPTLAQWFVELATSGKEKVKADLDEIQASLQKYGAKRSTIDLGTLGGGKSGGGGGGGGGGLAGMFGQLAAAAGPAGIAVAAVGAALMVAKKGFDFVKGLIERGLAGSNQMERFDNAMQRLADLVASAALPVLNKMSELVENFAANPAFVNSMQRIQQAMSRIADVATPVLVQALGKLMETISAFATGCQVAADLIEAANPSRFGASAGAGARIGAALAGRTTAGGPTEEVSRGGGRFEGVAEAFRRFQAAAVKTGPPRQEQLAQEQVTEQRRTNSILERLRPAFGL